MTKNTDFETVGAMHQCKKGEMFSTCVHCGAMAGRLNSPCPQYMRNAAAAMTKAAPVAPAPQPSPTAGMNMVQRILHVGGRNPPGSTYVEFGSIQAVEALVKQVQRDLPRHQCRRLPDHEIVTMYAECPSSDAEMLDFAHELMDAMLAPTLPAEQVATTDDPGPLQQGEYPETLYEGGRESVDDALAVVESFGPGVQGLNDTFARQVLLGQEVRRLRAAYEHACQGRSDFRNLYRASRGAAQAAPAPVAEDAEDAARWRLLPLFMQGYDVDWVELLYNLEVTFKQGVRAQAAQPEGGANANR